MRRGKTVLIVLLVVIILLWRPSPPFPAKYSEWADEGTRPASSRLLRFEPPHGLGLSVHLQTVLLQHHIAVITNRSLVYDPVRIHRTALPFRPFVIPWRNARIPLSAYVSSLTSGFETLYDARPAVSSRVVGRGCNEGRSGTKVVDFHTPFNPHGAVLPEEDGLKLAHQLQLEIGSRDASCVLIKGNVLDYSFFQTDRPLQLLESLLVSPAIKHYWPSQRVMEFLNHHLASLAPDNNPYNIPSALTPSLHTTPASLWRGLLVLELKGEAFAPTCDIAARLSLPFYGFNRLPLPGNEGVPPPDAMPLAAREGVYRAKCQPEVLEIIARARRLRKNHPLLRSVYVVTDASAAKADEIRMWLSSEGWEHVWIAKDDLWAGEEVGEGVDLEVARRAGVFIGNGFSPFSSTAVLLRQRDAVHKDLTQFW